MCVCVGGGGGAYVGDKTLSYVGVGVTVCGGVGAVLAVMERRWRVGV